MEDDPDPDARPVLILDDVFAELDAARRSRLAALVGRAEQVIFTAAAEKDIPAELGAERVVVRQDAEGSFVAVAEADAADSDGRPSAAEIREGDIRAVRGD